MQSLNEKNVSFLPETFQIPKYNRNTLSPGLVHLGCGAFHRTHLMDFHEDTLEHQRGDWGVIGVNLRSPDIDSIFKSVGGEKEYSSLMDWAANNLSQDSINSFDNLVNSGDRSSIQLALDGILAKYQNAAGYEGRMLQGKPARTNTDVYQSQAQLVAAMSDPRYDNDPAYRQEVIAKLDRSDLQF